jgi:hypothetical protein
MEYQKYLKYKSKYLQLKYKIENEAKSSQNREENNEDNNIIVHTRSPLQQMRINTYENEQEGGLTFLTGYYAIFCNSNNLKYIKSGDKAPTWSEIRTSLSHKGYSFKLFTARTVGKLGKAQGTKFNLITPTFFDSKTPNFIDEDKIDTKPQISEIKPIEKSREMNFAEIAILAILFGIPYEATKAVGFILRCVILTVTLFKVDPWDVYKNWQREKQDAENKNFIILKEIRKLQNTVWNGFDKYEYLLNQYKEKFPDIYNKFLKYLDERKEQLITYYKTIFILVDQPIPIKTKVPTIIKVNKDTKEEIIKDDNVDKFLIEALKYLSEKSYFNIPDVEVDLVNKKQLKEEIKKEKKEYTNEYVELCEEIYNLNRMDKKDKDVNQDFKKNVDKYNKDNVIDCCIIIDINVIESNNKFLKRYKLEGSDIKVD